MSFESETLMPRGFSSKQEVFKSIFNIITVINGSLSAANVYNIF